MEWAQWRMQTRDRSKLSSELNCPRSALLLRISKVRQQKEPCVFCPRKCSLLIPCQLITRFNFVLGHHPWGSWEIQIPARLARTGGWRNSHSRVGQNQRGVVYHSPSCQGRSSAPASCPVPGHRLRNKSPEWESLVVMGFRAFLIHFLITGVSISNAFRRCKQKIKAGGTVAPANLWKKNEQIW